MEQEIIKVEQQPTEAKVVPMYNLVDKHIQAIATEANNHLKVLHCHVVAWMDSVKKYTYEQYEDFCRYIEITPFPER